MIVILGVITIPLANVILGALRHTDQTGGRLAESHDAQIASSYWASDVGSLGVRSTVDPMDPQLQPSVETNVAHNGGLFPCGTAGTPNAVVRFAWDEPVDSNTTNHVVVSYVLVPAGARAELHRLRCDNVTTPASNLVLAHDLAAAPIVQCDGGSCAGGKLRSVQLRLTIQDPKSRESSYLVTLTGNRRQE